MIILPSRRTYAIYTNARHNSDDIIARPKLEVINGEIVARLNPRQESRLKDLLCGDPRCECDPIVDANVFAAYRVLRSWE